MMVISYGSINSLNNKKETTSKQNYFGSKNEIDQLKIYRFKSNIFKSNLIFFCLFTNRNLIYRNTFLFSLISKLSASFFCFVLWMLSCEKFITFFQVIAMFETCLKVLNWKLWFGDYVIKHCSKSFELLILRFGECFGLPILRI